MATRGKSARRKGHQFERDIANEFKALGWSKAKRHQENQAVEALEGRDLDYTEPFLVQTKKHKKYVSIGCIKQIQEIKGMYPLLITKGDNQKTVAVMYWEDLKELLKSCKKEGIF